MFHYKLLQITTSDKLTRLLIVFMYIYIPGNSKVPLFFGHLATMDR